MTLPELSAAELLPCPFCGAEGACHGHGFVGEHYGIVNCADCGGAMQVMPGTEAEAIAYKPETPS